MEPVYMNMQSYPHQDPMHYRPRCYAGMEPRPPMSYGCWPWGGHYGCHGCPDHAYMPAPWACGSPYSHALSYHCPGSYSYFPAPYMPPPPYSVMEHPKYEYEKNVPMDHHCCGCTNHPNHHPFYPKELRNVRIEEQEPEKENRKNDSLVPLQLKNPPYPIMWLPPDYYKEQGKVQDAGGEKDASRDVKVRDSGETAKQESPFMKGCLPVDLNALVSSKQGRDGEVNNHQEGVKRNFPFPLFWMPCKPDDMERDSRQEMKDVNPKPSSELVGGFDGEKNLHVNSGNVGGQTVSTAKCIPVKPIEEDVGKESSIVQEKGRGISARDSTDNGQKKSDDEDDISLTDGSKRKSTSPPKSSKLPPVCLRVDPLPRRKSANGKSRSPSPPGDKKKQEVKSNEVSKAHSLDNGEQVEQGKDAKTIAVVDANASPENSTNLNVTTPVKPPAKSLDDVPLKPAEVKSEEEHVAQKHTEDDAVVKEPIKADGMKVDAEKKCRELSEEEAAVIIQSAFRRFAVRRWKPIEKLKQIARVQQQIADVKHLIHEFQLSSSDMQGREKQKNIIAETILSLLLKLDTIQGLHPNVREVRKSVVRELVSLQEHLDSLTIEKTENSPTQEAMTRWDNENASNKSENVTTAENGGEIKSVDLQNQTDEGSNSNLIEQAAVVKTGMEEHLESSVDGGVKAAQDPATEYEDGKSNNEASDLSSLHDEASTEDESGKSCEATQNDEASIVEEDNEAIIPGQVSALSTLQDAAPSATATDLVPDDHDVVSSELAELPQRVMETDTSHSYQSKQLEDKLIESPTETADQEYSNQTMEVHGASGFLLNGAEQGTEETVIRSYDNYKLDDKFKEEEDSKIGVARSEPVESAPQQPTNPTADMIQPSGGSDERELPTAGSWTIYDKPPENSGSIMEEDKSEPLLQEDDLEKSSAAVDLNHSIRGISEMQVVSKQGEERNAEATGEELEQVAHAVGGEDGIKESNKKLMEENERLREMMEKLIKSGQEQVTAISSLSGRVKDVEKRLSRKKKLKVKQLRAPRSSIFD